MTTFHNIEVARRQIFTKFGLRHIAALHHNIEINDRYRETRKPASDTNPTFDIMQTKYSTAVKVTAYG